MHLVIGDAEVFALRIEACETGGADRFLASSCALALGTELHVALDWTQRMQDWAVAKSEDPAFGPRASDLFVSLMFTGTKDVAKQVAFRSRFFALMILSSHTSCYLSPAGHGGVVPPRRGSQGFRAWTWRKHSARSRHRDRR